jgi:hypothetical protein
MSVTTGTAGTSATPATDLYNLLATAMTNNGNWAEQSDSPVSAVNAGTTAPCRIWKCTGGASNFYIAIEVDDTNSRLRFRLSEAYNTTTHKMNQPAGGGTSAPSADTTSVTPTANGTVTDTEQTIGSTNPLVAYVEVVVLGTSYNYLYEIRNNLLTVATKVSATNRYCIVGCFTSLINAVTDTPLVLLGHPVNPGISGTAATSSAGNSGRFTRMPGFGASSVSGAFCACLFPLIGCNYQGAVTTDANPFSSIGGSSSNPWFNNHLVSPAIIQGTHAATIGNIRGMRGYLPDFVCGFYTNEPNVATDTITVGGVTYYPLGLANIFGSSGSSRCYIAIKG